jgi:hypothetical protein
MIKEFQPTQRWLQALLFCSTTEPDADGSTLASTQQL